MPVPFDFALYQLGQRLGVPPWALEDAPLDWLIRCLEFSRMEASVKVKRDGSPPRH